jgi:hypothetical protein
MDKEGHLISTRKYQEIGDDKFDVSRKDYLIPKTRNPKIGKSNHKSNSSHNSSQFVLPSGKR